jgi:anion-transporting  ArsA/GET3 family ATPase
VGEATYFIERLAESSLSVSAVVVNRVHPRFGSATTADARRRADDARASGDHAIADLWDNLALLSQQADAEDATLGPLLAVAGDAATARIPLRPADVHDLAGIAAIADDLRRPDFPTD